MPIKALREKTADAFRDAEKTQRKLADDIEKLEALCAAYLEVAAQARLGVRMNDIASDAYYHARGPYATSTIPRDEVKLICALAVREPFWGWVVRVLSRVASTRLQEDANAE